MAYYNPPNPYYPYSMTAPSMQLNTPANNSFVWVQGEEAAKAYPVAPNNRILFMDSEKPALYAKSTDSAGKPIEWHVYDLVERTAENASPATNLQNEGQFVTKDELSALVASAVQEAMQNRREQRPKKQKEVTADA